MVPFKEYGSGEIALALMPFLGGSQREWTEVVAILGRDYRCITIDLPGFGAGGRCCRVFGGTRCAMRWRSGCSRSIWGDMFLWGTAWPGRLWLSPARRLLVSGTGPEALVLVAPSPPGPEPMSDEKRSEMLASLGKKSQSVRGRYSEGDRAAAEKFIEDNIAGPIAAEAFGRTVDDVLVMNPEAWVAWLENGSKEDWAEFVGVLERPTMIVAGTKDAALGPEAQREKTLPHFKYGEVREVDCSHLIPLERAEELAAMILDFLKRVDVGANS